jgi:hypothetical protein
MTPEQRWEKIEQTLDYVATLQRSHDEQIGRLVEQGDRNERLIGALAERMFLRNARFRLWTPSTVLGTLP